MIRLDMPQGSPEWIEARLGIPTASAFHRIISPKTGKILAGSQDYLHRLVAERMIGASLDEDISGLMQRGKEMEPEAAAAYEFQHDCETETVGFILTDDRRAGCSPDRLVGEDGGLEIKCPGAKNHVAYMIAPPAQYRCQVQGALWVSEREWWDLMSYHPDMPPGLVRFERDEPFIEKLAAAVTEFCDRLDEATSTVLSKG